MANKLFHVTAYNAGGGNGKDLAVPKFVTLSEGSVKEVIPNSRGCVIKTDLGGQAGLKSFKCYETPSMVEAARDQSTTDLRAKGHINLAVSAAGTVQGDATALTAYINEVDTVGANAGVILPAATANAVHVVRNNGANPLDIYPATGETIDGAAANAPLILAVGAVVALACNTAGAWLSATEFTG